MSLEQDIKAMVEAQGLVLYDTLLSSRNGETIFEVLLQAKEGQVSLDQCAEVSHLLSPLLDVNPPVSGEYRLEVGTPGIERKLKKLEHFKHSLGEKVKITLITGELYLGTIKGVEEEQIIIESERGQERIAFDEIQKARTYFEW